MPNNDGGERSESELARLVASGDDGACREFVARYHHVVYAVAFRLLQDHQEAEDVTQEVFVRAYLNLKDFRGESKLSTWLYRMAYHAGLNCRRDLKRERTDLMEFPEKNAEHLVAKSPATKSFSQTVDELLVSLPAHDRMILTLFYLQELSIQEIAETLDLSLSAVKVRLFRARDRLRRHHAVGEEVVKP